MRLWLRRLRIWEHPRPWRAWSIVFGVLGPAACFAIASFDGWFDLALIPVDLFVLATVGAMATRIVRRERGDEFDAFLTGALFAGAVFAIPFAATIGVLGLVSVPLLFLGPSLEALLFAFLGVQPLVGTVTYLIHAARAWRLPMTRVHRWQPVVGFFGPAVVCVALFFAFSTWASAIQRTILDTDRPLEVSKLERWRVLAPGRKWPALRDAYEYEVWDLDDRHGPRAQRIRAAYVALTGRDPLESD
jgi:hypothetical protein